MKKKRGGKAEEKWKRGWKLEKMKEESRGRIAVPRSWEAITSQEDERKG